MIIIDRDKHPNLFVVVVEELHRRGYVDGNPHWTKIEIDKTSPNPIFVHMDDKILPGRFHNDGSISNCTIDHTWLKNLLNQNETLLIEFAKARLGH